MHNNKLLAIISVGLALFVGFYLGRYLATMNVTTNYTCNHIALFHQDVLMRKYGLKDKIINPDSASSNISQRARDLNAKLLEVCNTDPTR